MNLENIQLNDFTNLNEKDKLMVLSWRNDKSIRKWMYSQEVISNKSHMAFIDNLKNDKNNKYFLVKDSNVNIGVIYFNKINYSKGSCYFGLYGAILSSIKGLGRILEEVSINYAFQNLKLKKLKLEVFEDNIKVRNLHKKYKFKQFEAKQINNKKVICMELYNENR